MISIVYEARCGKKIAIVGGNEADRRKIMSDLLNICIKDGISYKAYHRSILFPAGEIRLISALKEYVLGLSVDKIYLFKDGFKLEDECRMRAKEIVIL